MRTVPRSPCRRQPGHRVTPASHGLTTHSWDPQPEFHFRLSRWIRLTSLSHRRGYRPRPQGPGRHHAHHGHHPLPRLRLTAEEPHPRHIAGIVQGLHPSRAVPESSRTSSRAEYPSPGIEPNQFQSRASQLQSRASQLQSRASQFQSRASQPLLSLRLPLAHPTQAPQSVSPPGSQESPLAAGRSLPGHQPVAFPGTKKPTPMT